MPTTAPATIPTNPAVRTRQIKARLHAAGIDASAAVVRSRDAQDARCVTILDTDLDAAESAIAGLWDGMTVRRYDGFLSVSVAY